MGRRPFVPLLLAVLCCGVPTTVRGQEAILTRSATQPAQGAFYYRQQLRFLQYDADPSGTFKRAEEFTALTMLSYGLTGDLSLTAQIPVSYRNFRTWGTPPNTAVASSHADHFGSSFLSGGYAEFDEYSLDETVFLIKWRVVREDYGPTNTARVSLFGGFQTPMFVDNNTEGGWNPLVGFAYTHVHDRHGWNLSGMYELTTSAAQMPLHPGSTLADAIYVDAAYLFRIQPVAYSAETTFSLYGVLELNAIYETDSDREIRLAPGILYEGTDLALEATVHFPLYQRLRYRPDREVGLVLGFRLLF